MMTDPGFILFGKKIGMPETPKSTDSLPISATHGGNSGLATDDSPKTPSIDEEDSPEKSQTAGTLKKPDKILPCPRCESMNTKFCYYNNSNVNQPRHFCKSCQRYWTAGGTMRHMPVGAGRRKKKNSTSDCRFIISHEGFESGPQIEFAADSDGVYNISRQPKVLSFTPNSPVCRSGKENGDDCSSGTTTVASSNSAVEKPQENNGFHNQVHWIPAPGTPWSYNPWVPMPGYPPIQFYPSPYWNSVPWLPPATSTPNFSHLGKHSSDRESIKPNEEPKKQKNSVLIPKTLRIDDPDEAAKSSIWATLGIKNENSSRRDVFEGFKAKGDEKEKHMVNEASLLLQANPAAFSRSLYFQERS